MDSPLPYRISLLKTFLVFTTVLSASSLLAEEQQSEWLEVDAAQKFLIKVSEGGFEPPTITLTTTNASVFVVNTSRANLLTLTVDLGGKKSHCASGNLSLRDGDLSSNTPIGPKDFAVFCLLERGEYTLTAFGMGKKPLKATVRVVTK
jgi:hypothetical protein